jgi:hypothetical protein
VKSTSKRQPSSSAFTWESNWEHELIPEIFVLVGKDICRYLERSFSLNMKWQGNTELRTTLPLRAGSERARSSAKETRSTWNHEVKLVKNDIHVHEASSIPITWNDAKFSTFDSLIMMNIVS